MIFEDVKYEDASLYFEDASLYKGRHRHHNPAERTSRSLSSGLASDSAFTVRASRPVHDNCHPVQIATRNRLKTTK